MGDVSGFHLVVMAVVTLIPFALVVGAFALLISIARDLRRIRKVLEGPDHALR